MFRLKMTILAAALTSVSALAMAQDLPSIRILVHRS